MYMLLASTHLGHFAVSAMKDLKATASSASVSSTTNAHYYYYTISGKNEASSFSTISLAFRDRFS